MYFPEVPDTPKVRKTFLEFTDWVSEHMKKLRRAKMEVYGLNFRKRGWDSVFGNIERKYGIIEEIIWGEIIKKRKSPTDNELVYLYDGLQDLANYTEMALWFLNHTEKERIERLADRIRAHQDAPTDDEHINIGAEEFSSKE